MRRGDGPRRINARDFPWWLPLVPERDWQAEVALQQARDRKARELLGLGERAMRAEIRRAFRRACRAHHPDCRPGEKQPARQFHLIHCAYKFLTEGEACTALDELEDPAQPAARSGSRMDTPWGYWVWWRSTYFGDTGPE